MKNDNSITENSKLIVFKNILNNRIIFAFILVIILFVIGEIIVPGFITFNHIMAVLQSAFFLGLVSLGQTIVMISGNEGIDLSVGSFVTTGVVIGAIMVNGSDQRLPLALLATILIGFIFGLVNGVGVSFLGIAPLIMTLAWGLVIQGLLLYVIKGHIYGIGSPILDSLGRGALNISIANLQIVLPYVIFLWIGIAVLAVFILKRTKPGFVLYAIGENNRAADLLGIKTKLIRMIIYGISSALSCITGLLLLGYVGSSHLHLGEKYIMPSLIAVIIGGVRFGGGTGNYLGTVAGVIFVTTLQSILVTLNISEGIKQVITGAVLVLLLLAYTGRKEE